MDITEQLTQLKDKLEVALNGLFTNFNTQIEKTIAEIAYKKKFEANKKNLVDSLTKLREEADKSIKSVKDVFEQVGDSIKDPAQKVAFEQIKTQFNNVIDDYNAKLRADFDEKIKTLNGLDFKDKDLKEKIQKLKDTGDNFTDGFLDSLSGNFSKLLKNDENKVSAEDVKNSIKKMFQSAEGKVTLETAAKGFAQLIATGFSGYANLKLMGLTNPLTAIMTATGANNVANSIANAPNLLQGGVAQISSAMNMMVGIDKDFAANAKLQEKHLSDLGLKMIADDNKFENTLQEMKSTFSGDSGIGKEFRQLNAILTSNARRRASLDVENPVAQLYGAIDDDLIKKQINETTEIIKSMGPYAEMMSKKVTENIKHADARVANYYYKAKKLMNLSDDDILKLTTTAVSLGKSFPEIFHDISKATKDVADKFHLDFKRMSTDVLTLRKDITNFAHKSSEDLAMSVAQIKRLGVSTQDAMSVFGKFQTFEDAATTAAQLGQSFGMVIDSMELLKAESPDETLQIYKDAFIASGKTFETMNRFERGLLLQQTGLSEQAAQALFSAENAGKSYEEIMEDIESKDLTDEQIVQMEKMKDSIEITKISFDDFKGYLELMNDWVARDFLTGPASENIKKYGQTVIDTNKKLALAQNQFAEGGAGYRVTLETQKYIDSFYDNVVKDYPTQIKQLQEAQIKLMDAAVQKDEKLIAQATTNLREIADVMNQKLIKAGGESVKKILVTATIAAKEIQKASSDFDAARKIKDKQEMENNPAVMVLKQSESIQNENVLAILHKMNVKLEDMGDLLKIYNYIQSGELTNTMTSFMGDKLQQLQTIYKNASEITLGNTLNKVVGFFDNSSATVNPINNSNKTNEINKNEVTTVDSANKRNLNQTNVTNNLSESNSANKNITIQAPLNINIDGKSAYSTIFNILLNNDFLRDLINPSSTNGKVRLNSDAVVTSDGSSI